jgi:phospho-N-acetylmuramoyl-pentapeptide-transferase
MNSSYLFSVTIVLTVFILTVMSTRILIPLLMRKHAGQTILEIGPSWHKSKEGTPTMGGIAPLFSVLCGTGIFLIYARLKSGTEAATPFLLTLLFAVANACVGMIDDATKLVKKRNLGLTPWQKLILQSAFAGAYLAMLRIYGIASTSFRLPLTHFIWNMGIFWYPISFLLILWFVNCANLTDGIDGLASSVAGVIGLFFIIIALQSESFSLTLAGGALLGSALGFLVYNRHPARIFMGDTGSLFFGALAVGCAFISGNLLVLLPLGIVYIIEGVSVVLQVLVYQITHGKRLFRMAPIHHHLEKCGWSEWKITLLFSLMTCLMGALTLWSYR